MKRYADVFLALLALGWVFLGVFGSLRFPFYGFFVQLPSGLVMEAAEGSSVRPGDRLLSINGRAVLTAADLLDVISENPRGTPLRVVLERDSGRVEASQPRVPLPARRVATQLGGMVLAGLFLAVGLLVSLRPTGKAGQLFFLFCLTVALLLGGPPVVLRGEILLRLAISVLWAALLLGSAFFLHFFLLFPTPHPLALRFGWMGWFLYVPPVAFLALLVGLNVASEVSFIPDVLVQAVSKGVVLVALAYFLWAVLTFVDSYRRLEDPLEREKLRWLVWGVAISILPAAAILGLGAVFNVPIPYGDVVILGTLVFLPISFGYAILSHRLMDIEIVLNRGLVYTAITVLLVIVFIVAENVLAVLSLELTGQSSFALAMGAAIVMAALVNPVKNRIQLFVDRLFFAYKARLREGLKDLAEELSFITDLDRMEHLLLRRLADLAHVSRAALFLREEGGDGYVLSELVNEDGGSGGRGRQGDAPPAREIRFDANDSFVIWLLREARPLSLETLATAEFHQRVEGREVEILGRMDAALCLPLRLRGDLIGFILLSRRRNRELFNRDEVDLLNRLAIQAASDLTNARLQSRSRRLEAELVAVRDEVLGGLRAFLSISGSARQPAGMPEGLENLLPRPEPGGRGGAAD
jgi:hypothetical protein